MNLTNEFLIKRIGLLYKPILTQTWLKQKSSQNTIFRLLWGTPKKVQKLSEYDKENWENSWDIFSLTQNLISKK